MHIHQPINVSTARLDEQWGNNHLICIGCSHDSPFKDKIREGKAQEEDGREKLEKETTNRNQRERRSGVTRRGEEVTLAGWKKANSLSDGWMT